LPRPPVVASPTRSSATDRSTYLWLTRRCSPLTLFGTSPASCGSSTGCRRLPSGLVRPSGPGCLGPAAPRGGAVYRGGRRRHAGARQLSGLGAGGSRRRCATADPVRRLAPRAHQGAGVAQLGRSPGVSPVYYPGLVESRVRTVPASLGDRGGIGPVSSERGRGRPTGAMAGGAVSGCCARRRRCTGGAKLLRPWTCAQPPLGPGADPVLVPPGLSRRGPDPRRRPAGQGGEGGGAARRGHLVLRR
jgi:hypothetical protein